MSSDLAREQFFTEQELLSVSLGESIRRLMNGYSIEAIRVPHGWIFTQRFRMDDGTEAVTSVFVPE